MSWSQTIAPNPSIPCVAGWCLQYVRQAFGLPARYGTAIEAWNASTSKHRDHSFPAGVAVPVWFTVAGVPAGHVALRMPDGSVYSSTDAGSTTPRRHPNMADLMQVYANSGMPMVYLGWTEDVASYRVVSYTADAPRKSNDQVAADVIAGAYGTGDDRVNRLRAAGYDPAAVQVAVNARLAPAPAPARKSNDQLANEVIAGHYGTDPDRSNRLRAEGYDPGAVQAEVNRKLAGSGHAPAPVNIDALAHAVIRGEYGNGAERAGRLGVHAGAVQTRVNQILGG